MATKRSYADPCGRARALDLIGERWALLIVRELVLGPKRFTDLRAGLPHVGPDVLSQRLRELESAGILRRRTLPPPATARVYELTDRGTELEPVLLELGRWGSRAAFGASDQEIGVDAFMLALKTLFDQRASDGLETVCELRCAGQAFTARIADQQFELTRAHATDADATITGDPGTLARVLWHGERLSDARRDGRVKIDGSSDAASRFLALFPPPQPVGVS
jgi:DNA-binding HxlR family transcriptional regulator